MMFPFRVLSFVLFLLAAPRLGAVVIHELHYHPTDSDLEFIELHNAGSEVVLLAGWSFTSGIEFVFPEEARIAADGYVLVCRDRAKVSRAYGLAPEFVFGDYEGRLSNSGERVELTDAEGVTIESIAYDDALPWPPAADGEGPSLQRLCSSTAAQHPANWTAEAGSAPTPLERNVREVCPPPALPPPVIGIQEIHYHPLDDRDAVEEYVELRNNTDSPVNLRGYAFTEGISYTFTDDAIVSPGGLLVVARNLEHARVHFRLSDESRALAVGNFEGRLSNSGERLTLSDATGAVVDSVRYADRGLWPGAADGLGHSLEKLLPEAVTDDPASWRASSRREGLDWRHATLRGEVLGNNLRIYINAPGEFLIDNVTLVREDAPDVDVFENGSFDAGIGPWVPGGNHEQSGWAAGSGPDGSGALRIVSTGRGSARNSVLHLIGAPLERGVPYQLTFDYAHVSGSTELFVRLANSTVGRGLYFEFEEGSIISPGRENGRRVDRLPPFVESTRRQIQEPASTDEIGVIARVRAFEPLATVELLYRLDLADAEEKTLAMTDDGLHADGLAGDGVYGATLPPQPHNTAVLFRIRAVDVDGRSTLSPGLSDPSGFHGYYVNDNRPDSTLPVYHLLFHHTEPFDPLTLRSRVGGCDLYKAAALAYRGELFFNVGLRRRGGSVCGDANVIKPYMKMRFNPGRLFEGQRKINLQSLWTDKSLTREPMSWELFESLGYPSCKEYYVRLHLNGDYLGLFAILEQPDSRFLDRSRLNRSGNLYKAVASREEHYDESNVRGAYEKKTNEDDDFSDLVEFLDELHTTPQSELVDWFSRRVDEDRMIDYQVGHILIANTDYFHKNHYLFHDTETGRWMPLLWDLDLTFGKSWSANFGGVLHDKLREQAVNPWFSTSLDAGGRNHFQERFFTDASAWYGRAYLIRLWDAIREKHRLDLLDNELGRREELLFEEQADDIALWGRSQTFGDEPDAPADFLSNLDRVRQYVGIQRGDLVEFFERESDIVEHARLRITELHFDAEGDDEDAEWLELWNPDDRSIEVSGWHIEGIGFEFPEQTWVGADEVFVVARNPAAFVARYGGDVRVLGGFSGRLDNNGETLRVKDSGPGYPATVDFLRYVSEGNWPQGARGDGHTLELTEVSSQRDNDPGEAWRRSLEPGGSPGAIEKSTAEPPVPVRRGDLNADARINVTDAVLLLQGLFGDVEPPCLAALDVNSDATADVTDGLALLRFLFRGGALSFSLDCRPAAGLKCRESNCPDV